jgi:hypothetical protein
MEATVKSTNKFANLKEGEILSETQYYTVIKVSGNRVQLQNDKGELIVVDNDYVNSCLNSADQYKEEKIVSRTELTQIFLNHPYTAMTANFNKKVDEKDVLKEILDTYANASPKEVEKKFKSTIKKALQGEERTISGYHSASVDEFGRINFIDMKIERSSAKDYDNRIRLVDPRTLNWVITKNTKYKIK